MESNNIRTALSGIFIYFIFKLMLQVSTELLLCANMMISKIEDENVLIGVISLMGFMSLGILTILYRKFLGNNIPNIRTVYYLLVLFLLLYAANLATGKLYGLLIVESETERILALEHFALNQTLNTIFQILALVLLFWKMHRTNNSNIESPL